MKKNILFIHIPKTGGTSLEHYFFGAKINQKFLYSVAGYFQGSSLQHLTYQTISKYRESLKVDFNDLVLLTIVRNPYDRLLSEMFWRGIIKADTSLDNIAVCIERLLKQYSRDKKIYDNHLAPQYEFLIDNNNNLVDGLIILKTESLTSMMHDLGYKDFNLKANVTDEDRKPYSEYLNGKSISLINDAYKKDFEYFGYEMISVEKPSETQ